MTAATIKLRSTARGVTIRATGAAAAMLRGRGDGELDVMSRRAWTESDLAVLRATYATVPTKNIAATLERDISAVHRKASKLGLLKSAECIAEMARQSVSIATRMQTFKKGNKPWSTGTKGVAGVQPNSRKTQFKKGELVGRNAKTYIPIGGHRVNGDGYVCRKVRDDGLPQNRFVPVHRLVWAEAHGEIPAGHVVVFRRGMKTTDPALVTLDRLELLTNAQNLERNRLPPELQKIAALRGALTKAINKRVKEQSAS